MGEEGGRGGERKLGDQGKLSRDVTGELSLSGQREFSG